MRGGRPVTAKSKSEAVSGLPLAHEPNRYTSAAPTVFNSAATRLIKLSISVPIPSKLCAFCCPKSKCSFLLCAEKLMRSARKNLPDDVLDRHILNVNVGDSQFIQQCFASGDDPITFDLQF